MGHTAKEDTLGPKINIDRLECQEATPMSAPGLSRLEGGIPTKLHLHGTSTRAFYGRSRRCGWLTPVYLYLRAISAGRNGFSYRPGNAEGGFVEMENTIASVIGLGTRTAATQVIPIPSKTSIPISIWSLEQENVSQCRNG